MKTGRVLTIGLVLAVLAGAAGCGESESESDATALLSPSGSVLGSETAEWIPDISEVTSVLEMTADQKEALEAALVRVRASSTPDQAAGPGRGGMRGRGFRHAEVEGIAHREPPFFGFLEACAGILEPAQFVDFLNLLSERHEAHRDAMAERHGERWGEGRGPREAGRGFGVPECRLADDLDLTDDQRSALDNAREAMRQAMDALHEACRAADTPREECRTQARVIHEAFRARMEEILTSEQLEHAETLRNERRVERTEKMGALSDERLDRRVEFLTRVLGLDESQAAGVMAILDTAHDRVREVHDALRNDEIEPDAARDTVEQIRGETDSAILDLLTESQATVFGALRDFLPGHGSHFGHGRGPGLGCGGGGPRSRPQ